MKPYRQDPSAPRHLRKLLDSARDDGLDAARRRRVAAQLGIVPGAGPPAPGGGGAAVPRPPRSGLAAATLGALGLLGLGALLLGPLRSPVRALDVPSPIAVAAPVAVVAPAPIATSTLAPAATGDPDAPAPTEAVAPVSPTAPPTAPQALRVASIDVGSLPDARRRAPAPAAAALPTAKVAEADSPSGDLRAEILALDGARRAAGEGKPRSALSLLDDYAARFPAGKLREEAQVLRIEALAASGDHATAEGLARRLLQDSPTTPYAARVRAALATGSPEER